VVRNPPAEFKKLDRNGGGQILFDEFSGWALKRGLELVDDDPEEGEETLVAAHAYSADEANKAADKASMRIRKKKQVERAKAEAEAKAKAAFGQHVREMAAENIEKLSLHEENIALLRQRQQVQDKTDSSIHDEEAGKQRLRAAQQSATFYKQERKDLQLENLHTRTRLKNVKSKTSTHNAAFSKRIEQRQQEEAKIEALLIEIRERVQGGTVDDDREGMHALEKQLAKAQRWVVAPPTKESAMFKYNAPPTAFLESMLSAVHQPTQYWDAQYDASPEAGAQNGWEQKDLVHLQFGSSDSVTDAFGRPLRLK